MYINYIQNVYIEFRITTLYCNLLTLIVANTSTVEDLLNQSEDYD